MSMYPFIAEEAEKDVVFKFLTENKISVIWDINYRNYEVWNNIFLDGIRVMQIDQGITIDQFQNVLRILDKNINAVEFPDNGKDFKFTIGDHKLFKKFLEKYRNIF
jgi:hypothetical protein